MSFKDNINKLGRSWVEGMVGGFDGTIQGLTGIDIVGDDFYKTEAGKSYNRAITKAMPIAAGATVGVATGNPQAGMATYKTTSALGTEAHADPVAPTDPYNGINPAIAQDGMPTGNIPKMFNIEKGELVVDPATGEIIEDLDSYRYKPHSKNKKNEHQGNFIELPEGLTIIPKKDADKFRKNPNLRKGIIRNVENLFKERMAFGKDSNGNIQEYNKVLKAQTGVMTDAPIGPWMDPNSYNVFYPQTESPYAMPGGAYPTLSSSLDSNIATGDPNLAYNPKGLPASEDIDRTTGSNNLMTPGNYVGLAGALIGGLGPLGITKKVGIDRDEFNTFGNVSNRAADALSSVLGKSREEAMRTLRANTNMATNINRNASSNFSTMSARNQSAVNNLNQNVGRTALQYDVPLAQGLSSIYGNADMAYAGAEERRLERLDQNRDNYYSNLSSNLTNLGQLTQHTGREMNRTKENQIKLNTLQSSDFKANADGTFTHLGEVYIFDPKTNSFTKK